MICHAILCRILAMLCDVMLSDCICRCRRCLRRSARWSTRLFTIITTPPACSTTSIVRYPSLPSLFFLSDCSLCSVLRFISVLLVRLPCPFPYQYSHSYALRLYSICSILADYEQRERDSLTVSLTVSISPFRSHTLSLLVRHPNLLLSLLLICTLLQS